MVVKRECPHKPAGGTQTTSTSSSTATPDGKKVSKVKAATKSSNGKESKGSIDDVKDAKNPKGKDAKKGGSQPMPEPAAPADLPQAEPMGEPAAETATDLLKEATGLLKSIRGLKAFRVKSVGEGLYGFQVGLRYWMVELHMPFDRCDQMKKLTSYRPRLSWPVDQRRSTSTPSAEQEPCGTNHSFGLVGGGGLQDHLAKRQHCDPSSYKGAIAMQLERRMPSDVKG